MTQCQNSNRYFKLCLQNNNEGNSASLFSIYFKNERAGNSIKTYVAVALSLLIQCGGKKVGLRLQINKTVVGGACLF